MTSTPPPTSLVSTAAISAHRAGRLTHLGLAALGARHSAGLAISLAAVLDHSRRPAIRARPWGTILRIVGRLLAAAGLPLTQVGTT